MASVPVTICAMVYPKNKSDPPYPATLVGFAWVTGLSVGGGPMPGGGDQIWGGGNEPFPTPPIHIPPEKPTPPELPSDPGTPKPPPPDGGWGWHPDYGWGYFPGGGGKPQPPGGAAPPAQPKK